MTIMVPATTAALGEAEVRGILNDVVDPCSAGRGVPIGLCDMGLVQDVAVHHNRGEVRADLRLRVTSPGCHFVLEFDAEVRRRLAAAGVTRVTIDWDSDVFDWTPEDIAEPARLRLQRYRQRLNEIPVPLGDKGARS